MKILIIGASGLVGSNCYQFFKQNGYEVTGTYLSFPVEGLVYFNSVNLAEERNVNIKELNPEIIIHCGALTNVDYCEQHPEESYEKTVVSVKNVATIAKQIGARIIYLSTDYVFDGLAGPYTENDDVNPLNEYGRHKLAAEQMVLTYSEENLIVRVTNVYGDEIRNKNFISRIIEVIKQGDKLNLSLPFDQFATPVNAFDIARVIHQLLVNKSKGLYHIGSTDYLNRVHLFKKVLEYFPGYKGYELQEISTIALNQPALRPLRGGLLSLKFITENPAFEFTNVDYYLRNLQNTESAV
ncbi:MAG: SDR family oxidoreductase [Chitinophagaceae bacterium]|nr:SDR family oxidoreductase [Chitinophagaceae bacterium]MBP7109755.1 SDR family oxidoreductase [Chitinophagaceae bacterium]MBP7279132.1 SDR family oxidoreductase [Sedimentibacter sp.]HQZ78829.1 SDR family oxidoreductase [Bacteroidia bacterium]